MDLNLILWISGISFSLGIFAVKVGFGLSFGAMKWKGILLSLFLYLVLFIVIAMLSKPLVKIAEPVLKKGVYLHILMALGMILWGMYLIGSQKTKVWLNNNHCQINADKYSRLEANPPCFKHPRPDEEPRRDCGTRSAGLPQASFIGCVDVNNTAVYSSLALLIPCPVCLTAITFATWAVLNVIKLPASVVGLGLGIIFSCLSLLVFLLSKLISRHSLVVTQRIGLGLSMLSVGLYFIASLFLPAKIEAAKGVFQAFLAEGGGIERITSNNIGVFALLFAAFIIGYSVRKGKNGG